MFVQTQARKISAFNCHPKMTHAFGATVRTGAPFAPEEKPETNVTQLANGARVVTQDLAGPLSAIGVYNLAAGAKYDPLSKPGLNYVMRCSLMLSNVSDSMFQFDRQMRSIGASFEHQEMFKQYLGWKAEVRRDKFPALFQMMCNGVAAPRFMDVEITRFRDTMDAVYEENRWQRPREYCVDGLSQVAFYKEGLGQPLYVPAASNDDCSPQALMDQYCARFVPQNMVVAGVNVDHGALVSAYETAEFPHSARAPHFRDAAKLEPSGSEKQQYQGGREFAEAEKRYKEMGSKPSMENETIAAIGWCSNGHSNLKDYATSLVAQQMIDVALDDAIRVPTGLDRGVRSFYTPFESAGLLGVTIRADPKDALATLRRGIDTVAASTKSTSNLASAIQRACVRFHHDHVELRRDYVDFLATSVGTSGKAQVRTVDGVLQAIRGVTAENVRAAMEESLARDPCLYVTGACGEIPSLRQLGLKKKQ